MNRSFRLGATSYIYPGSLTWNARQLGPLVDDIELVLFDAGAYGCNFPTPEEIAELAYIAGEFSLTYTVHLPMDVRLGNESLDKACRVIELTAALHPFAIILHFDGYAVTNHPTGDVIEAWQEEATRALATLMRQLDDPTLLCVENLEGWDPRLFDDIVEHAGVRRCVDVGHLWLEGKNPLPYLQAHLPHTRVVHVHGLAERDHVSLAHVPHDRLTAVIDLLSHAQYAGVVTVEVFGQDDFFSSLQALAGPAEAVPRKTRIQGNGRP